MRGVALEDRECEGCGGKAPREQVQVALWNK